MKITEYNDASNLIGLQCTWCGCSTPVKYLFPIMVSRPKQPHRELHNVCFECIAANNVPKGVTEKDLPWYDGRGKRVNPNEKVFVSFARTAPVR